MGGQLTRRGQTSWSDSHPAAGSHVGKDRPGGDREYDQRKYKREFNEPLAPGDATLSSTRALLFFPEQVPG